MSGVHLLPDRRSGAGLEPAPDRRGRRPLL